MIPQPVKWYAVTVDVVPEAAEAVEFAFNTLGADGTEIDQMPGGSRETQAVVGYFDSKVAETAVRDEILNSLNVYGFDTSALHGLAFSDVEKRDWLAEWKKHWKPTIVGRFVIAPPWDAAGLPGKIMITIEPKMAFGTGTHETTQLCLEAIGKYYRAGDSFLDVGTGTGILAIAAAKLNEDQASARLYACDTDAEAVELARENAEANDVSNIRFEVRSVVENDDRFDVVCANLTAQTILPIIPLLLKATGGTLILSGILREQKDEIAAALKAFGVGEPTIEERGEWIAVIVDRR